MAVTIYGVVAVSFMMVMYAPESRSRHLVPAYALSSGYVFLAGTWPFGIAEAVSTLVALRRHFTARLEVTPG